MALTDVAARTAKPKEKAYKLTDERGLYLVVDPRGGKLWRFNYRFERKQKTLACGTYPDTSLKLARENGTKRESSLLKVLIRAPNVSVRNRSAAKQMQIRLKLLPVSG